VQPPTLTQYDEWGRRIDRLDTSEGWRILKDSATREGYIAIAYDRAVGKYSRLWMFFKSAIMTGDYHIIMCPFGMADGTTRVLELYGTPEMKRLLLPRLKSRNPSEAYISGQWMTERPGGSDLSLLETTAYPAPKGRIPSDLGDPYILNGFKWFSSAAEGNMALALARVVPPPGSANDVPNNKTGTAGLALFLVPLRMEGLYPTPLSNGVKIHRLKNKFGTKPVPTAELELQGVRAWLVPPPGPGQVGGGIKLISAMLNITRVHSGVHLLGSLSRALSIARSYAQVRYVPSQATTLNHVPLHNATLAQHALTYRALAQLVGHITLLLGVVECPSETEQAASPSSFPEEPRLRLLTPILKAFGATRAIPAIEECLAACGGWGYMEESGLPRLVRDVAVERIWEGTVAVMAEDVRRALGSAEVRKGYIDWATYLLTPSPSLSTTHSLSPTLAHLRAVLSVLPALFHHTLQHNPLLPGLALEVLGEFTCGVLLFEHAMWALVARAGSDEDVAAVDVEACRRWVSEGNMGRLISQFRKMCDEKAGTMKMKRASERMKRDKEMVYGPGSAKL